MILLSVSICLLLLVGFCQCLDSSTVSMEKMTEVSDFSKLHSSAADLLHDVVIAVTQRNMDQLHDMLMERSHPNSILYQQWLSTDEIDSLTQNKEGVKEIQQWLASHDISITHISKHLNYIHAKAPIKVWENVLQTKFHYWKDTRDINGKIKYYHRSEDYTIPSHLTHHITAVLKTSQIPPILHHHGKLIPDETNKNNNKNSFSNHNDNIKFNSKSSSNGHRKAATCSTSSECPTTVDFLNDLYSINTNLADDSFYQAVFQTNDESFSQSDLSYFQKFYGLTSQAATVKNTAATTCSNVNYCSEGNLDIQYVMGVAQKAVGVFWYTDENTLGSVGEAFLDFLVQVYATDDLTRPTSLSISWGAYEKDYGSQYSYIDLFNTEAQKLGLLGVTIFAATGDDGVSGYNCNCTQSSASSTLPSGFWSGSGTWTGRGYFPFHPASSPYVVAVGATQGPNYGLSSEIACQSQLDGIITTGGGFSMHNPRPSYQDAAVTEYLATATAATAASGYNSKGRGYPDISFLGVNYPVRINGQFYVLYGTSASTPVAAAMITLINAGRKATGKNSTVGFIHPTLYTAAVITNITNTTTNITTQSEPAFTDIVSGNNKCCASSTGAADAVCCASGFTATKGWDPTTGLGSISFATLATILDGTANTTNFNDNSSNNVKFSILQLVGIAIGAASVCLCLMLLLIRLCFNFSRWCNKGKGNRNSTTISTTRHPGHNSVNNNTNLNNYL